MEKFLRIINGFKETQTILIDKIYRILECIGLEKKQLVSVLLSSWNIFIFSLKSNFRIFPTQTPSQYYTLANSVLYGEIRQKSTVKKKVS